MKVRELIAFLQAMPQEMDVAYQCFSEQVILDAEEIRIFRGCAARDDAWIQNARPDKESQEYLLFPGN